MKVTFLITVALSSAFLCNCSDRKSEIEDFLRELEVKNTEQDARIEALSKQLSKAVETMLSHAELAEADETKSPQASHAETQKPEVATISPSEAMQRLKEYGILDYSYDHRQQAGWCKTIQEHFARYSNGDENITDYPYLAIIIALANYNGEKCPKSCILSFIEAGADVNQCVKEWRNGLGVIGNPLEYARSWNEQAEIVDLLLEHGAKGVDDLLFERGATKSPQASHAESQKPEVAAISPSEAMQHLSECGILDYNKGTSSVANFALAKEWCKAIQEHFARYSNGDENITDYPYLAIIIALAKNNDKKCPKSCILSFIKAGAHVNQGVKNWRGGIFTPLDCARSLYGQAEIVVLLLEHGAKGADDLLFKHGTKE